MVMVRAWWRYGGIIHGGGIMVAMIWWHGGYMVACMVVLRR